MPSRRRSAALGVVALNTLSAGLLVNGPAPADAAPASPPGLLRLAAEGGLDPSFSPDAVSGVTTVVPGRQYVDVAVQQDGRIVAVSDQSGDFFISRFNPDGSPDLTFSTTGTGSVMVDVAGAGKPDQAKAVAIDSQDRIVVVGSGGATVSDLALVRLTSDGRAAQISTHFHVGNPGDPSSASDVAFQSDGTIVVAGSARVAGDRDFAWARLDGTSGALIGSAGTHSFSAGDDEARGVAVYPSGPDKDRFVMVGVDATIANSAIGVLQRAADGGIDSTFNNSGGSRTIDLTPGTDVASGVAITGSGSVVVAGNNGAADQDLVVTQLLPTGAFDGAFNLGAVRTITKTGSEAARSHPLALQADGKIVLVGDSTGSLDVGVFRLNPDGTTDPSFGTSGDATFDVNGNGNDDANAVAIDRFGRVLVAGDDLSSAGFVARLLGPDSDGDGVRDADDACPTAAGILPNGCTPEALLKGRKVVINTVLAKTKASAKCPAKAEVAVKTKTRKGKLTVTKMVKTKPSGTGCLVKGKVKLSAKPKKSAKTKIKITGTKLKTKRLVAVRL